MSWPAWDIAGVQLLVMCRIWTAHIDCKLLLHAPAQPPFGWIQPWPAKNLTKGLKDSGHKSILTNKLEEAMCGQTCLESKMLFNQYVCKRFSVPGQGGQGGFHCFWLIAVPPVLTGMLSQVCGQNTPKVAGFSDSPRKDDTWTPAGIAWGELGAGVMACSISH